MNGFYFSTKNKIVVRNQLLLKIFIDEIVRFVGKKTPFIESYILKITYASCIKTK
jgi:hypothetical protein